MKNQIQLQDHYCEKQVEYTIIKSKRIELRFVHLLLLLLLLRHNFAHFFQIAIAQPIFELGPSDFGW